jgi:hypothetical protein
MQSSSSHQNRRSAYDLNSAELQVLGGMRVKEALATNTSRSLLQDLRL